jgi:hypothetical protein
MQQASRRWLLALAGAIPSLPAAPAGRGQHAAQPGAEPHSGHLEDGRRDSPRSRR